MAVVTPEKMFHMFNKEELEEVIKKSNSRKYVRLNCYRHLNTYQYEIIKVFHGYYSELKIRILMFMYPSKLTTLMEKYLNKVPCAYFI